jgi:hypothetical protein
MSSEDKPYWPPIAAWLVQTGQPFASHYIPLERCALPFALHEANAALAHWQPINDARYTT